MSRLMALAMVLCLVMRPQFAAGADPGASVAEPAIQAQGAVVIDTASGEILYGKNEHAKYYPASITKLMTALLVIENCSLDDTVTFSKTATTNLEAGAVSLGMTAGDQMTVRQCLYALLLKSANEVGNALAEHVSGSIASFADLMNQKAAALGCTGTHFANPHGLNDPNHYTTPYDMALIGRAAFANQTLREIDTTLSYKLPATKNYGARTISMGHKMMYPDDSRYYEGIIGGKTGFTSLAGNTLVTGAERNGVRLVAVVMKANGTHYTDTKALLDYGFAKMAARGSGSAAPAAQPASPGPEVPEVTSPSVTAGQGPQDVQPSEEPGIVSEKASGTGQDVVSPAGQSTGQDVVSPAGQSTGQDVVSPAGQGTGQDVASPAGQDTGQNVASPAGQTTGWVQDAAGWYYTKQDGSRAAGEWLFLDDGDYWIDSNGYMATGWRLFDNGDWYYFHSGGAMAENYWVLDHDKWFYLGGEGPMLKNTVTPDGYTLDAAGAWTGR